jgi:hypothetical protein
MNEINFSINRSFNSYLTTSAEQKEIPESVTWELHRFLIDHMIVFDRVSWIQGNENLKISEASYCSQR